METQIQQLAEKTWKKYQDFDASRRYIIALAGVPGSGKTTTAASIVRHLNALHHDDYAAKWPNSPTHRVGHAHPSYPDVALCLPLDGYHLTRAELSAMPNPEEAHYRRGAAFTFNSEAYLKLVETLRKPLEAGTRTIHAPSFDHAKKDPVENDIHIPPTARIVILEGLYVAMNRPGWRDAAELMDDIWFIDTPLDIAAERVSKRNFQAGLSPTYEEALDRTEKNDMRNAREILAERVSVDEIIQSIPDEKWRAHEVGEELENGEDADQYGVGAGMRAGSDGRKRGDSQAVIDWDPNSYGYADGQNGSSDRNGMDRPTGRTERMDSIAELAAAGGGC